MNRFFNGAIVQIALLSFLLLFSSSLTACSGKIPPATYSAKAGEFRPVNPLNHYTAEQIKEAKNAK